MKDFETSRLLLRHIVAKDAEEIYAYGREKNVGLNAGWSPHKDIEETRQIMRDIFIGRENVFAMVLKETGKIIGTIGFLADPRRENPQALMLGYAISEKYWGKGLTTEAAKTIIAKAFKELPINIISCTCYSSNTRSKRVIEKCGFKYEGTLRQAEKRCDGEILDIFCYSLLKDEIKTE